MAKVAPDNAWCRVFRPLPHTDFPEWVYSTGPQAYRIRQSVHGYSYYFTGTEALFEGATEDHSIPGLGIIPGRLTRFDNSNKSVHHIAWNSATVTEVYDDNLKVFHGLGNGSKTTMFMLTRHYMN